LYSIDLQDGESYMMDPRYFNGWLVINYRSVIAWDTTVTFEGAPMMHAKEESLLEAIKKVASLSAKQGYNASRSIYHWTSERIRQISRSGTMNSVNLAGSRQISPELRENAIALYKRFQNFAVAFASNLYHWSRIFYYWMKESIFGVKVYDYSLISRVCT
jgi:hypothetical protein